MNVVCSFCGTEDGPLIVSKTGAFICERCAQDCLVIFEENRQKRRKEDKQLQDEP